MIDSMNDPTSTLVEEVKDRIINFVLVFIFNNFLF